jgi:hypothetical protein
MVDTKPVTARDVHENAVTALVIPPNACGLDKVSLWLAFGLELDREEGTSLLAFFQGCGCGDWDQATRSNVLE